MRKFATISAFVQFLSGQIATIPVAERHALEKVGELVEHEAKRVIGTYEYGWPQLAQATQTERVRLGFTPNDPLLRTGEMRASIEHKVRGRKVEIGSNSKIALYQEMGTVHIPPRPFLSGALHHKERRAVQLVGIAIGTHLSGKDALVAMARERNT